MPLYINRRSRVRHVDPQCSAIRASLELLDDYWDPNRPFADDPKRKPTARLVQIPDPTETAETEAIRDFTSPCTRCVPGARQSRASLPIDFEDPYEYDE